MYVGCVDLIRQLGEFSWETFLKFFYTLFLNFQPQSEPLTICSLDERFHILYPPNKTHEFYKKF